MRDSSWRILYELYHTPNITKVANKLYITQPSLTKRLQRIEEIFGVKIVNRTTKGVEFTSKGILLAEKAEEYIAFMNGVKRELSEMDEQETQLIRIGSSYTYSKYYLPDILFEYKAGHPNVQFEVVTEQSGSLFKKACDRDLDVAFVRGDYEGDMVQHKMDVNKAYVLTSTPCSMEQLKDMPRIDYKCNARSRNLIEGWWQETFSCPMPSGSNAGFVDVAWQMASKGLGYTCSFLSNDFDNKYNLSMIPMLDKEGNHIERNTWFVYKEGKHVSATMRSFISYVKHRSECDDTH